MAHYVICSKCGKRFDRDKGKKMKDVIKEPRKKGLFKKFFSLGDEDE